MRKCLLFLLTCLPLIVCGQKENSIWIFPLNVGLNFNSIDGKPTVFPATVDYGNAPACISDANGELLFYTNGDSVWNRNKKVMPNGAGLQSSYYTYIQSTIVVPVFNHPGQYYLFTVEELYNRLNVSVIDMSLDGGLGDIVPGKKKILLATDITTSMVAIKGEGCYIWLLAHRRKGLDFLAYRIDANGIDTVPVVSASHSLNKADIYHVCDIVSSPDRTRIAVASDSYNFAELHDFNPSTGVVSNPLLLHYYGNNGRGHSASFSPNGSKLYVCGGFSGSDLVQYDLSMLPAIAIQKINDSSYLNGGMRLGPDGKIYCANWEGVYTILHPDLAGKACRLSFDYITLPAGMQSYSRQLGEDMVIPDIAYSGSYIDTVVCSEFPAIIKGHKPSDRYLWSDGDTAASKVVTQSSRFWVQASTDCGIHTDTFKITVSDCRCTVSIPDAFTPNNDGRNDKFRVLGTDITEVYIGVYNRYGQRVFQASDIRQTWDGTFAGGKCDVGTYYYFARVRCIKGQEIERKGEVVLVR